VSRTVPITSRNASFQQWQALLTNRTKRHRAGEFLVQGVRPITLAVEYGHEIRALIYPDDRPLSDWAMDLLDRVGATRVAMAADLLAELGDKDEQVPELVALIGLPADRLTRIAAGPDLLAVVFDRPTTPGNIGTLIRSADAFGASGVIITGHAADPYDPKAVRASTGSLFAVPVVRAPGHAEVIEWITAIRRSGIDVRVIGADEHGAHDVSEWDLTGPTVLLVGNETHGLSSGWRQGCDEMVRIPITGAASSLNAAAAATVVLYEATRQRRSPNK
jgi:tRNA G18 (ribose-2'-O)-methylase SpoU